MDAVVNASIVPAAEDRAGLARFDGEVLDPEGNRLLLPVRP